MAEKPAEKLPITDARPLVGDACRTDALFDPSQKGVTDNFLACVGNDGPDDGKGGIAMLFTVPVRAAGGSVRKPQIRGAETFWRENLAWLRKYPRESRIPTECEDRERETCAGGVPEGESNETCEVNEPEHPDDHLWPEDYPWPPDCNADRPGHPPIPHPCVVFRQNTVGALNFEGGGMSGGMWQAAQFYTTILGLVWEGWKDRRLAKPVEPEGAHKVYWRDPPQFEIRYPILETVLAGLKLGEFKHVPLPAPDNVTPPQCPQCGRKMMIRSVPKTFRRNLRVVRYMRWVFYCAGAQAETATSSLETSSGSPASWPEDDTPGDTHPACEIVDRRLGELNEELVRHEWLAHFDEKLERIPYASLDR